MMEHGRISAKQFRYLVMLFTIGSPFLYAPTMLALTSKQDAWITGLFTLGVAQLLVWLYCEVGDLCPGRNYVECSLLVLGKRIGFVSSLLFLLFMQGQAAFVLRDIGDFMTTQIMPETPLVAINIIFMMVVTYTVYVGLEPMSRTSEMLLPYVLILIVVVAVTLISEMEPRNLLPILEKGFWPLMEDFLPFLAFPFTQQIALLMVYPYVNNPDRKRRSFYIGNLIGGGILVMVTVYCVTILGVGVTINNRYPSYALAKKISLGNFVERIEVLVGVIWIITIFYLLSLTYYALILGASQLFRVRCRWLLHLLLSFSTVVFSIIYL
jgi:spore germination protein KB